MTLAPITTALDELRAGRPIIVVDDENRENEGDIVMAAQSVTPEWVAWTIRYTSGYLCAPMTNDRAAQLNLPLMVQDNKDVRRTAYTVTVDAAEGVTTGISAADRARTLHVLANPSATPDSIIRPGHIVPLRAVAGGVRERAGHTEATVELLQLAGLEPVGVIGEITNDDGTMMRLPELIEFGAREGVPVVSIEDLIAHLGDAPLNTAPESARYQFEVETNVPTTHGTFRIRSYSDRTTGVDHLAIIGGEPTNGALVRLHSECLTGEAFGSLKCECGPQLDAALDAIDREGGVVIYLRGHEGRAIGLTNKLRAYRLQEQGLDTYDANIALGLPADAREYGVAKKILDDLGIDTVRLLSNNPDKRRQLIDLGISVPELVPLIVGVGDVNVDYLSVKRDRMGHELPDNLEPDFIV
ncbi:3,4-dihydroxy 2-butanone 4-phosphate synthase/GTP cyclohydrolase II [Microbacteriaceae bacterium MWH-Ta3]|nr:3,4-dihydroxy 2-butanone 4-phosphate synthase/GTP cyclohydrolase II [Microbacteriaceae bacterium MWH-Ta3]